MHPIRNQQFAVTAVSAYAEAVTFTNARLDLLARRLLTRFAPYGLRAGAVFQRAGDHLFDYELTFSLFGRNAFCRVGSEKVELTFQNGRDEKDMAVVNDGLLGVAECLNDRQLRDTSFEFAAHVSLPSVEHRQKFLAGLGGAAAKGFASGGAIAYSAAGLFPEVRFLIDRSNLFPEGIYLGWSAQLAGPVGPDTLKKVSESFRELAGKYELVFEAK